MDYRAIYVAIVGGGIMTALNFTVTNELKFNHQDLITILFIIFLLFVITIIYIIHDVYITKEKEKLENISEEELYEELDKRIQELSNQLKEMRKNYKKD